MSNLYSERDDRVVAQGFTDYYARLVAQEKHMSDASIFSVDVNGSGTTMLPASLGKQPIPCMFPIGFKASGI